MYKNSANGQGHGVDSQGMHEQVCSLNVKVSGKGLPIKTQAHALSTLVYLIQSSFRYELFEYFFKILEIPKPDKERQGIICPFHVTQKDV